jgi:hypothetical protein
VHDLERETLRLTLALAQTLDVLTAPLPEPALPDDEPADVLLRYQRRLERITDGRVTPSPTLTYRQHVRDVREAICDATPPSAVVAVVTRGDDDLLRLHDRRGLHLPADTNGEWAGHHPGDLGAVMAHLRRARDAGAQWFALPSSSAWWLDHYTGLAAALGRGEQVATFHDGPCAVWSIAGARVPAPSGART